MSNNDALIWKVSGVFTPNLLINICIEYINGIAATADITADDDLCKFFGFTSKFKSTLTSHFVSFRLVKKFHQRFTKTNRRIPT